MIFLMFTAMGIISFFYIPKVHAPYLAIPQIEVTFGFPDAPPTTVEREVTSILEGELSKMPGIRKIESISFAGGGKIWIRFNNRKRAERVRFEISRKIEQLSHRLPVAPEQIQVRIGNPVTGHEPPLLEFAITSSHPLDVLFPWLEDMLQKETVHHRGIRHISLRGWTGLQWQITLDPKRCLLYDVTPFDMEEVLQKASYHEALRVYSPAGKGQITGSEIFVRIDNRPDKVQPENTFIKYMGDQKIYLRDIATIRMIIPDEAEFYHFNGKDALKLSVVPFHQADLFKLEKYFIHLLDAQSGIAEIPFEYKYLPGPLADTKQRFNGTRVRTLSTLLILLVCFGLYYRDSRLFFAVFIGLMVNISAPFLIYYLSGITLHTYSLAGFAVSLGIVIDNSIIMITHLAAHNNRRSILSILAASFTTMASLILVFVLPEDQKTLLAGFSGVLLINIAVSFFVALILIPALYSLFCGASKSTPSTFSPKTTLLSSILTFTLVRRNYLFVLAVLVFGIPLYRLPAKIDNSYWLGGIYNQTMGSTFFLEHVKPLSDVIFGGTLRLFDRYVEKEEVISQQKMDYLSVSCKIPDRSTEILPLDELLSIDNQVIAMAGVDVLLFFSRDFAEFRIYFDTVSIPEIKAFRQKLISRLHNLDGLNWMISGYGEPLSIGRKTPPTVNHVLEIRGFHFDTVAKIKDECLAELKRNPRAVTQDNLEKHFLVSPVEYHKRSSPSIKHKMQEAAMLSNDLCMDLETHAGERMKATIHKHAEEESLWDFLESPVGADKMRDIITMEAVGRSQPIYRANQEYIENVHFRYIGREQMAGAYIERIIQNISSTLPIGFEISHVTPGQPGSGLGDQPLYIFIVALMIYIICAVLFESLRQPLAVVLMIPFSYSGVFLFFYATGAPFGQGGYASLILLAGLTVNSAIYIINAYNNSDCENRFQALADAFRDKLGPIFLTLISTIFGFVPFLFSRDTDGFWYSLAIGTIGGLIFSILAILFILPGLLVKRDSIRKRTAGK
jgi:multidrug efflux pump subunit AcrB